MSPSIGCCCRVLLIAVITQWMCTQLGAQSLLAAPLGGGGGEIAGGLDTVVHSSTGGAIEGGVFGSTDTVQDKAGYTGQLYDPSYIWLTAPTDEIPEESSLQLGAKARMDDGTELVVPGEEVAWSWDSGVLASIDASGVAFSLAVFEDRPTTVQGTWSCFLATLDLTVTDTIFDNFGSYAEDEISDGWQVAFFGLDNPDALAVADPDRDGQDNLFEFLTTADPTDPTSSFRIQLGTGNSVKFSPVSPLRAYTLFSSSDLQPSTFEEVSNVDASDFGGERTIVDLSPPPSPDSRRFYRVLISIPPE